MVAISQSKKLCSPLGGDERDEIMADTAAGGERKARGRDGARARRGGRLGAGNGMAGSGPGVEDMAATWWW